MKKFQRNMLIASLFAVGLTSTNFLNLTTTTVKAEVNSILNNATVKVTAVQAPLYDKFGERLSRSLTQGSAWKVDSQQSTAIGNLYRVATNEYVRASDVQLLINTHGIAENNNQGMGQILLRNKNLSITSQNAPLYDMLGRQLGKSLPQGSAWKVNSQNNIPSGTFYQVASNEFVKASDVYLYDTIQPNLNQTIRITTNYAAPVSNGSGQIIPGRYLDAYTLWKTDKYVVINNIGYYHVGNNEYVNAYYVR